MLAKEAVTNDHRLCDSTDTQCPEQANPRAAGSILLARGWGDVEWTVVTRGPGGVSSGGNASVQKVGRGGGCTTPGMDQMPKKGTLYIKWLILLNLPQFKKP